MGRPPGVKNKVQTIRNDEVLTNVKGLTLDSVNSKLAATQVEISRTLGDVGVKLTSKLNELGDVESAIQIKKDELKNLYDIEYSAQVADDLNNSIEATRQAWAKEQEDKLRRDAEAASEKEKARIRMEEEYSYSVLQKRKKDEDAFRLSMEQKDRESKEKHAILEKGWLDRENALKTRETKISELEALVADIPNRIKKESDAHVAIATNSLKKEYETRITLLTKDSETDKKLATQEINSLNATITKLSAQIIDLQKSLAQAHNDVKDISAKALESASNRAVADALKDAMGPRENNNKPSK